MKTLAAYLNEQSLLLENKDGIINEGFWAKLGELIGFNTKKLNHTMKDWSDDLKAGFTTGQYLAVKSKDKKEKEDAAAMAKAAEKGDQELLKTAKETAERIMKNFDVMTLPDYPLAKKNILKELANKLNDAEGKEMAEKLSKLIDKKWPDGGKLYDKEFEKLKKANVLDGPKDEKSADQQTETPKAVIQATTDTIKDNSDILTPLAKKADVDGNVLRNFVGAKLRSTLDEKTAKKGTRAAVQKALGKDVILGTSIMVLGALITNDSEKIAKISEIIGSNAEELTNNIQKYNKQYK